MGEEGREGGGGREGGRGGGGAKAERQAEEIGGTGIRQVDYHANDTARTLSSCYRAGFPHTQRHVVCGDTGSIVSLSLSFSLSLSLSPLSLVRKI